MGMSAHPHICQALARSLGSIGPHPNPAGQLADGGCEQMFGAE